MKKGTLDQTGEPGQCGEGKPMRQYSMISSNTKA